jgi:hypothetical protein
MEQELRERRAAGISPAVILEEVASLLALIDASSFSEAQLEAREYTYVSAHIKTKEDVIFENFIVSSPYKQQARLLARIYLERKGLKCAGKNIYLYPRNYIDKARKLFAENKYL